MAKRRKRGCLVVVGLLAGGVAAAYLWYERGIQPAAPGNEFPIRFEEPTKTGEVLVQLQDKGVVRNPAAMRLYAYVRRKPSVVRAGTYRLKPGMDAEALFRALAAPIRQLVRLPETNWAQRTANLLERAEVASAKEYMDLIAEPQRFQSIVSVPLPAKGTLEGYLYPDTYDLPPLLGAKGVIERQLANFERKVSGKVKDPAKLHRALIVASMVELEVALDKERPIVAGVIENRLKLGMPLQIDACLNYAIQKWRPLTYADYRNIDSPYNTYRHKGLPPGPICSPSVKSVQAALSPAKHSYLYYVAMPGKYHLFTSDYGQHLRNIQRRRKALAGQAP